MTLSSGENIENRDTMAGDILELIWRDAILMESKNRKKDEMQVGSLLRLNPQESSGQSREGPASDPVPEGKGREGKGKERKGKEGNIYAAQEKILSTCEKVFGHQKKFTDKSTEKLKTRMKTYSIDELCEAFENLTREVDQWKIQNNGHRSLDWWLHSDDRIENMRTCHLKGSGPGMDTKIR